MRLCDPGPPRVALVTSQRENLVQVVLAGPHVVSWTHTFVHLGLTDISCQCTCSICNACFIVWWPHHAADAWINQRQGFLCRHTTSIEWAADSWSWCGQPLLFVTYWKIFCSSLPVDTGKQTDDDCFVMCLRSPSWGWVQVTLLFLLLLHKHRIHLPQGLEKSNMAY